MLVLKCTRSFKFINGSHHILAKSCLTFSKSHEVLTLPLNMNLFTFSSFSSTVYIAIAYLTATNAVVAHNDGGPSRSFYLFFSFFLLLLFLSSIILLNTRVISLNSFPPLSSTTRRRRIHLEIKFHVSRHDSCPVAS